MQLGTVESAAAKETEYRQRRILPCLLGFTGGLFAIVATFALLGGIDRLLLVWPVSGILIALSLPFASVRASKRLPMYLAGGAGVFVGGLVSGLPWGLAALIAALTILDLTIGGFF